MRTTWLGRGLAATLVAAGLLLVLPHHASAHARILSVYPAPDSKVAAPLGQMLLHFNEPIDRDLFRLTVDSDRGSVLAGRPVFKDDETVTAALRPDATGYLVVTWVAVGLDAHPVVGQYYIAVKPPGGAASLGIAPVVSSFESGGDTGGLTALIEAARSVEIVLLYAVLGIVFLGALLWQRRRAPAATGPGAAVYAGPALMVPTVPVGRAYRVLLIAGTISAALMPLLFWLNAQRLSELLIGVGISRIAASSIGLLWGVKAVLWLALVGVVALMIRRAQDGRSLQRLPLVVGGLGLALVAAFVAGTHVGTGSATPALAYIPLMALHILLTATWAGGLIALLLVVIPGGDTAEIWTAVSRFSRVMTVTAGIAVASGLLILIRLLANFNALWCTSYGVVAGFKVSAVALALCFGLLNNRLVAGHRREEELPEFSRMQRRAGPTVATLRRTLIIEAVLLLGVLVLAAVLGETQLPPLFNGRALPGDVQNVVEPGLFGSGCQ
ncbi:MAG TPA: CopD family protein [Candidatus Dormibacteraeota bacterium]|nr:CopD family protein [Candidatus Dormibacteraeota bacterium]